MKRFSTFSLVLVSALVLLLLSGCVATHISSITFQFQQEETLHGSEQLYVRYSDGTVSTEQSNQSGQTLITIQTYSDKTIVGFYVSDGIVSWVPNYSYGPGFVSLSRIQKPTFPVDHVIASQPVNDNAHPGFVNVTFAVYGTNGELVNSQTEVFAHSTDPNLTFYNTDSRDASIENLPINNVNQGFSSYAVNGFVTFVIQSDISDVSSKPISLYSGSKLIYDSNISPVIQSLAIGFASGDSANNVKQNLTLPTIGANGTSIAWNSGNSSVLSTAGVVTRPSANSGDATVTLTAEVSKNNFRLTKSFTLNVKHLLMSTNASLSGLTLSQGDLTPVFSSANLNYTVEMPNTVSSLDLSLTKADSNEMLTVTGAVYNSVTNNVYSYRVSNLIVGSNPIQIMVTAQDGTQNLYNISVNRASIMLSDLNHDGVIDIVDVILTSKQNSISLNRENMLQLLKLISPKYVK